MTGRGSVLQREGHSERIFAEPREQTRLVSGDQLALSLQLLQAQPFFCTFALTLLFPGRDSGVDPIIGL